MTNTIINTSYRSFDGRPIYVGSKIECLSTGLRGEVFIKDEQFVVAFSAHHLSKNYFLSLKQFCKDPVKIIISDANKG